MNISMEFTDSTPMTLFHHDKIYIYYTNKPSAQSRPYVEVGPGRNGFWMPIYSDFQWF